MLLHPSSCLHTPLATPSEYLDATSKPTEPSFYSAATAAEKRVLVLGNAQLAQMVGARGPNMQTNAACAGSTLAVAMAQVCSRLLLSLNPPP